MVLEYCKLFQFSRRQYNYGLVGFSIAKIMSMVHLNVLNYSGNQEGLCCCWTLLYSVVYEFFFPRGSCSTLGTCKGIDLVIFLLYVSLGYIQNYKFSAEYIKAIQFFWMSSCQLSLLRRFQMQHNDKKKEEALEEILALRHRLEELPCLIIYIYKTNAGL